MFDAEFTRKVGGPAWKSMDIEDDNLVSSEEKPCEERAVEKREASCAPKSSTDTFKCSF